MGILGIFHTIISVLALFATIPAHASEGKINLDNRWGKYYALLTIVACLTSFGIFKTGHAGPGHVIAGLILVLMAVAYFLKNSAWRFATIALWSTTVFLSLIPTFTEIFTRLPLGAPLADSPEHPLVQNTVKLLLLLFLGGLYWQYRKNKSK